MVHVSEKSRWERGKVLAYFSHLWILTNVYKRSGMKCLFLFPSKVCIVCKRDTGILYAMKYMSKATCVERDALRNVLREIEILTQVEHKFVTNLWFSFQGKSI